MIGGAEVAVKEITDRLPDFAFDLICARIKKDLPAQEKVGQVNVYRLGSGCGWLDKFLLPWRGARLAGRLQKEKNYDAIWTIMASFGGLAALFFKKKNPGIPYLLTLQEGDSPEHIRSRAQWLGPYWRQIFARADYLTVISNYLADFGRQHGAVAPIEVVPNGVNLKETRNENKELRKKLDIKDNEKVFITASRLVPKNGLADLIEAVAELPTENYKLLILGSGPLEKDLKLKVERLKIKDRVLFLGEVAPGQVAEYLSFSDIFVRPSLSEGLGNAFLEAMAAGVPVIGPLVGGIPDFLKDGETGLVCEVRSPGSIAEKIKQLLADEALRQKLIVNGRQLVEEKYNWDKIARQVVDIFNKLNARK